LSFGIILITWVNHHATLELVRNSSASFIYVNGFVVDGCVHPVSNGIAGRLSFDGPRCSRGLAIVTTG
jgi:uncharacterized membrane protein